MNFLPSYHDESRKHKKAFIFKWIALKGGIQVDTPFTLILICTLFEVNYLELLHNRIPVFCVISFACLSIYSGNFRLFRVNIF